VLLFQVMGMFVTNSSNMYEEQYKRPKHLEN